MNFPRDLFGVFAGRRDSVKRRRPGRQGRGGQSAASGRGRRRQAPLSHEAMEARLALAVDGFSSQPFTPTLVDPLVGVVPAGRVPGWAVLIADSSDDLYVQQVATVPQALLYADNGSFVGAGEVSDVDNLRNLYVTNGERRREAGVTQDNGPVYAFNPDDRRDTTTRFVLEQDDVTLRDGVLEYTQADGVRTRWTFDSPDGATIRLLTGPGVGSAPAGDYIVPVEMSFREPSAVNGQSHIEVRWRAPGMVGVDPQSDPLLSPFSSNPVITQLRYTYADETTQDASLGNIPKTEFNIQPSTRAVRVSNILQPTTFTLRDATGAGSLGVVAGTLTGTMRFGGKAYPFRTDSFGGSRLVFDGGETGNGVRLGYEYVLQTGGLKPKVAYGSFDAANGVISLYFASAEILNTTVSVSFAEQDPGFVSLDVSYGVYVQGLQAGSVTFFAGQDITRQVDVDLLTPGSTINVDSPIVVPGTLDGGDVSLRATNVNLAAKVDANDRLDIGASVVRRSPVIRTALVSSEISGGRVVNLFSPSGLGGVGYDGDNPPTVTIAGPNGEVNALLGDVTVDRNPGSPTFGQVIGIQILDSGFGYDNVAPFTSAFPTITISSPAGGVTATAVAVLDGQGRVTAITITNGGSGYAASPDDPVASIVRPQAEAVAIVDAAGRLVDFTITNPGSGYSARPDVTVAAPVAVAAARIGATTVAGGAVTSIAVAASGYGYAAPPRIWIQPPPRDSGGSRAVAEAVLDAEGRVVGINVIDGGMGYESVPEVRIMDPIPVAHAETVRFESNVAATVFDVRIAEELGTDVERGAMLVSTSGSLAGEFFAGGAADAVFVQAEQADVIVEGTIWAKNQTYILQSRPSVIDLVPFAMTTVSAATGADTGLLRGGTVAITLGNDTPTPADGAVAFNDVSLRTDIDSIRIRAATSAGVTRSEPFPYELRVAEDNSIAIEAVAASSFPVTLGAGSNMLFNASLATASDVNVRAGGLFTLAAPVSTTKGRISVAARNVTVDNSLRVTAADADDFRDDIVIEATGGSIGIAGLVSAVNNVSLRQVNQTSNALIEYSSREPLAIPDNTTVSRSITISDSFTFADLDVAIDITHPFVSDLSAVLIAPGGGRFRLFAGVGGAGDNFTGTIFDSEASAPITAGTPPFTGRFRPRDSLAPLYGRDARGTWTLEVSDNALIDQGSLTNFSLQFTSSQAVTGHISGPARVRANQLAIDAEGVVGDPAQAPGQGNFYLRTNVNSLSGRAGGSFSIDEINDISITDLRAGGLVSVRASGVDPAAGPNAGKAALTASLADVPAIDVNAPAGSIDVVNNAPVTIIVGNSEALRRSEAISMRAAGNVSIRSTGGASRGEIFALDAPLAGSGARTVRYRYAPSALPAGAIYVPGVPGTTASTITGTGSLSTVLGVAAANLRVNDRVLVAVVGGSNANGVYSVTRLGGGTNWLLTRAADSDTAAELPANSFVRVTDGVGAGFYQLTYVSSTATPFARCPIGVSGALSLVTNIGSDDVNDAVTFVVSTAGVTNTAAGSLGKMIELRQANDTSSSGSNPNQTMDFRFSSQVLTPIRLTQQLPRITEPFRIDGNTSYNPPGSPGVTRPRITVDGSRIVTNRDGNAVTTSGVNGFEVAGTGAVGAVLANMTVAGFTKGAAVQVQDASTVLVSGMTLGTNELGLRVANQFGLRVSGNSSEVTLLNSTVTAATSAGVRIENGARDVVLVGNTIGTVDRDNAVGVQVAVSAGNSNRIGVEAVEPIAAIPPLVATRVNATTFTLPGSVRTSAAALIPGLGITGVGIVPADGRAAVIQSVSTNATTGVTTVVLTGGQVTAGGRVTFGHFAATTLGSQMLTMPVGVSADQLYLGQRIAGTGIVAGTRITAIDRATKVVTLSAAMTATGVTSITFPGVNNGAPRNVIQSNLVGVELAGGATTITNTSIINSARDGVRITGGTNVVGRADRTRSAFSNMIYGNGGFGIAFDAGAGSRAAAVTLANQQTVRGNYLGMLMTNRAATANTKGNIGLRFTTSAEELYRGAADMFLPRSPTGLDAEGNQHSPGTSATGGTGSGGGGGGIPPVRPTR
jgi:subtilisin-like proprotein convertase family protein